MDNEFELTEEAQQMFLLAYATAPIVRSIMDVALAEGKMRVAPRVEALCREFFTLGYIASEVSHG